MNLLQRFVFNFPLPYTVIQISSENQTTLLNALNSSTLDLKVNLKKIFSRKLLFLQYFCEINSAFGCLIFFIYNIQYSIINESQKTQRLVQRLIFQIMCFFSSLIKRLFIFRLLLFRTYACWLKIVSNAGLRFSH